MPQWGDLSSLMSTGAFTRVEDMPQHIIIIIVIIIKITGTYWLRPQRWGLPLLHTH